MKIHKPFLSKPEKIDKNIKFRGIRAYQIRWIAESVPPGGYSDTGLASNLCTTMLQSSPFPPIIAPTSDE